MTLAEIAKIEGVSERTIARIEARALKKFKEELAKRGLTLKDLLHD